MEPERLVGQVLAHEGHAEVGPVAPAELGRQRVAPEPRGVRAAHHLPQQFLPLAHRHAPVGRVGARELAAVVEELRVLVLQRDDLAFDEGVEVVEERLDVGGGLHHAGVRRRTISAAGSASASG